MRGRCRPLELQLTARLLQSARARLPGAWLPGAVEGVLAVTNPLPAVGGSDPEPAETLRTSAPREALLLGRLGDDLVAHGEAGAPPAWPEVGPSVAGLRAT